MPPLKTIDLSPDEKGRWCAMPRCFNGAVVRDPDVGGVCLDCCIELLRARRVLENFERRSA